MPFTNEKLEVLSRVLNRCMRLAEGTITINAFWIELRALVSNWEQTYQPPSFNVVPTINKKEDK